MNGVPMPWSWRLIASDIGRRFLLELEVLVSRLPGELHPGEATAPRGEAHLWSGQDRRRGIAAKAVSIRIERGAHVDDMGVAHDAEPVLCRRFETVVEVEPHHVLESALAQLHGFGHQ